VILAIAWGAVMVGGRAVSWASLRFFGGVLFVLSTAFLLQHLFGPIVATGADLEAASRELGARTPYGPGGWLALSLTPFLVEKFGSVGLFILLSVLALVSFLLATEMAFYPALQGFTGWLRERREERGESLATAVAGWTRRLAGGLWSFLRGADLPELDAKLSRGRGSGRDRRQRSGGRRRRGRGRSRGRGGRRAR
jgi:hypothetical protein